MRSDPRHLAVIPHHGGDGDGDNPPSPGPATPVIPSLARSFSRSSLRFSPSPFLSPSRSFLSSLLLRRVFCLPSPSGIVPLVSAALPRGLSTLRGLSLTRKLADPISTKLHCVSYLHAVASIYSVRNCTLPSPFPFTSRCIQYFTSICGAAHLPQSPIHLAETRKNLPFRPSRFVSPLE